MCVSTRALCINSFKHAWRTGLLTLEAVMAASCSSVPGPHTHRALDSPLHDWALDYGIVSRKKISLLCINPFIIMLWIRIRIQFRIRIQPSENRPPWRTSMLQEKPSSALKREDPALQNMILFHLSNHFLRNFCPPGFGSGFRRPKSMRIRINTTTFPA